MVVESKKEEPIREIIGARPMSKVSDKFWMQNVRSIDAVIKDFNSQALPNFPMTQEDLLKKISVFVDRTGQGESNLFALDHHGRSASLNKTFNDAWKNEYNYINIKGLGIPSRKSSESTFSDFGPTSWGLVYEASAMADWRSSNMMLANNVKTSVPIAIAVPKTFIMKDGKEVSVEKLEDDGVIYTTSVLYARGFSEVMRLLNAGKKDFRIFAKEHGIDLEEYPSWLADRTAGNLARMHNIDMIHVYTHWGNVTLDGCIVDNDSVTNLKEAGKNISFFTDVFQMRNNILAVEKECCGKESLEATSLFLGRYLEEFTKITENDFKLMCRGSAESMNAQTKDEIAGLFEKRFGKKEDIFR
jgi:hypothetical protein